MILCGALEGDWRDDLRSKVTKAIKGILSAYGFSGFGGACRP